MVLPPPGSNGSPLQAARTVSGSASTRETRNFNVHKFLETRAEGPLVFQVKN